MVASRRPTPIKRKDRAQKSKKKADKQIPLERGLSVIPPTQAGMFDHILTSSAMHALVAKKFKLAEAAKAFNKVQKEFRESFKTLCAEQKITDGHRIRIESGMPGDTPYAMNAKLRKGGGHSVETWESLGAVDIHKLEQ